MTPHEIDAWTDITFSSAEGQLYRLRDGKFVPIEDAEVELDRRAIGVVVFILAALVVICTGMGAVLS